MFLNSTKSQIMVETMVALAMVVIGMLGMLGLLSSSIGINRMISDQHIATYLASEGIEVVKNIIDINTINGDPFNNGVSKCNLGCKFSYGSTSGISVGLDDHIKFDSSTGIYSYYSGEETPFTRVVFVKTSDPNPNELIVTSNVKWKTRGNIDEEVVLEDHFINWRQ